MNTTPTAAIVAMYGCKPSRVDLIPILIEFID
jgi:hypothetical protein